MSNGGAPLELTAQMHTTANRLSEVDAADLAFVMRRDELVEDLVLACAKRIEQVTARKGVEKTVMIGKLWKIKSKKGGSQKRRYRYGLNWKRTIGSCFQSGDTFGVLGPVVNARRTSGPGKGNRMPRTAKQLNTAREGASAKQKAAARILGKQAATARQNAAARVAAKVLGKQAATERQKVAARVAAKVLGKQAATERQKAAAKVLGKQSATEKQKTAAQVLGKRAATNAQKEAVASSNKSRRSEMYATLM